MKLKLSRTEVVKCIFTAMALLSAVTFTQMQPIQHDTIKRSNNVYSNVVIRYLKFDRRNDTCKLLDIRVGRGWYLILLIHCIKNIK